MIANCYADTLAPEIAIRYKEKLKLYCDNIDPYSLDVTQCSKEIQDLPNVTTHQIFSYLMLSKCPYNGTTAQSRNLLDYENATKPNCVLDICAKHLDDISIVLGVVKMEGATEYLNPWFVSFPYGYILCAHCTCASGTDEMCIHIQCLLYKVQLLKQEYALVASTIATTTTTSPVHTIPSAEPTEIQGPTDDLDYYAIDDGDFNPSMCVVATISSPSSPTTPPPPPLQSESIEPSPPPLTSPPLLSTIPANLSNPTTSESVDTIYSPLLPTLTCMPTLRRQSRRSALRKLNRSRQTDRTTDQQDAEVEREKNNKQNDVNSEDVDSNDCLFVKNGNSSSDVDEHEIKEHHPRMRFKRKKHRIKEYVCGICSLQFQDKNSFKNHCQQNHMLPSICTEAQTLSRRRRKLQHDGNNTLTDNADDDNATADADVDGDADEDNDYDDGASGLILLPPMPTLKQKPTSPVTFLQNHQPNDDDEDNNQHNGDIDLNSDASKINATVAVCLEAPILPLPSPELRMTVTVDNIEYDINDLDIDLKTRDNNSRNGNGDCVGAVEIETGDDDTNNELMQQLSDKKILLTEAANNNNVLTIKQEPDLIIIDDDDDDADDDVDNKQKNEIY